MPTLRRSVFVFPPDSYSRSGMRRTLGDDLGFLSLRNTALDEFRAALLVRIRAFPSTPFHAGQ